MVAAVPVRRVAMPRGKPWRAEANRLPAVCYVRCGNLYASGGDKRTSAQERSRFRLRVLVGEVRATIRQ